jgi:hypothetical protein
MKEVDNVFYRMISALSKFLKGNEVLFSMTAIKELVAKIDIQLEKIERLMELIDKEEKGKSVAVITLNEKVVALLYSITKALEVHFTRQGDPAMVAELHRTRSGLQRASIKTLAEVMATVVKVARDNIAKLAIYNVYDEELDTVQSYAQQLVAASTKLEATQDEKKAKRDEMAQALDEAKQLVEEVDMVVEIICLTQPAAYKSYTEVRSKKSYAERLFTIVVLNSETGRPEENARVVVQSTTKLVKGKPFILIDRKTGKTGEVRNSKREFDIYTITVEKIGCEIYTHQLTVADSKPQRLEVLLKKKTNLN